ncbi:AraC family transcriptional regulator [Streptomyces sp. GC420]|uniref:helix-turn-helix domain-containing protein n=1 Tax=Streptomyces sp. GC420 TaxID=2697568 RepID=UPI001414F340|nr:helix-turn-helix domain-containing protein [Streptomyces sp. GC420]NBM17707.1 helix-turn-helix domain-containing protein [Streptomyces sp. GC420]
MVNSGHIDSTDATDGVYGVHEGLDVREVGEVSEIHETHDPYELHGGRDAFEDFETTAPAALVGHPLGPGRSDHPGRPGLSIEALTLTELRKREPAITDRPVRLELHELVLVESGHGAENVDFTDHECAPGTLLWLRPGQVRRDPVAPPGLDGYAVRFAPSAPSRSPSLRRLLDDTYDIGVWRLAPQARTTVTATVRQLAEDYATACGMSAPAGPGTVTPPLGVELLSHQLTVLLLRIAALPLPPGEDAGGDRAVRSEVRATYRRFRRELECHFDRTRQVEVYARLLGYSAKTLNRVCRAATGRSAKQVVDGRVVLEAKRLLAHTDMPAVTVGRRLGFTEATNFGKFFTHHAGVTPGEFRSAWTTAGATGRGQP